jgi:hypothetical protein
MRQKMMSLQATEATQPAMTAPAAGRGGGRTGGGMGRGEGKYNSIMYKATSTTLSESIAGSETGGRDKESSEMSNTVTTSTTNKGTHTISDLTEPTWHQL